MTVAWPFPPQMEVVETLEWLTDVQKCKRAEQRRCLREMPRITYSFRYQMDSVDYGVARELARTIGGDPTFAPDWPNATQVPTISAATVSLPVDVTYAPAYRVGGSALIISDPDTYEVVSVTGLGTGTISISATASGYTKPWVVPLRLATFSEPFSADRGPHLYVEAAAALLCTDTEDLLSASGGPSFPTYLGDPVVTDPVEVINSIKESNLREVAQLDSQAGGIYKYPIYATPNQSAVLAWTAQNAAELWAIRVWLHTRRGRWKRFWTSNWNGDVVVTRDIHVGDSTVQIAPMGFASKYSLPVDMGVMVDGGGFLGFRVTGVTVSGGNEYLDASAVFSGAAPRVVDIICAGKLTLSRLDSDRIEIQHLPGRQGTVVVATKEVPIYP